MDLLGLTNAFLIETGVADEVQALEGASDDVLRAKHWCVTAWQGFQVEKLWSFRFAEKSHNIVNGTTQYNYTALGLDDGDIVIPGSFYNAAGAIEHISYLKLRELRRSAQPVDTSRIHSVAVKDGVLHTYPDVDTTQALEYDIRRAAQVLDADKDIPYGLPSDYHMLIVHRAVAKWGALAGGQEGANLNQHHGAEYRKLKNDFIDSSYGEASEEVPPTANTLLT